MANSFTAFLNLEKPEVGADSNLWGGHLNSDLDIIDSIFTSATTRPQSTIIKSDSKWVDATTTTKGILFSLTGINTTTTRTITWKDSDGTVAFMADIGTATTGMATTGDVAVATTGMVTTSGSQTLTNKTIDAAANTVSNVSLTSMVTGILPRANGGTGFGAISPLTNSLAADVAMNNTALYFDGPVVAQGTVGTWLVTGTVVVDYQNGNAVVDAKLWDGTTVIASAQQQGSSNTPTRMNFSLSGFIANPAGNLRISVRNESVNTGAIKANASGVGNTDSTISAVRII